MIKRDLFKVHRSNPKWALLALAIVSLFLSGCATLVVTNETDNDTRIVIHSPDSEGVRVTVVHNNAQKTVMSLFGGGFTISVLPDQTLLNELTAQKAKLLLSLSNPDLSADEIMNIQNDIKDLRQKIAAAETEAKKGDPSCSGIVLDYGSMSAIISTDPISGKISLSCAVQAPQISGGSGQ